MEYEIRFCTTSDNARLAYAIFGAGPTLVIPPGWVSLLELDTEDSWTLPLWRKFSEYFKVIIYDKHGCGLSDRDRTDFSFEKELNDLESIIECANLGKFSLFGYSQSGPTSIAYANKYPNRISHLILYGSYRSGALLATPEIKSAMRGLIRAHWGLGSTMLSELFVPHADKQTLKSANRFQQKAATAEMAASLSKAEDLFDVTDILSNIKTPTLVMHRLKDRVVSSKLGRELAATIPNAKLVLLDGNIHLPWLGDFDRIIQETAKFIGVKNSSASGHIPKKSSLGSEGLSRRLAAIMSADVKNYSKLMQEDEMSTINILNEYRDLFIHTVNCHRGKVIDAVGDNILSEFSNALDAVTCAVEIQKKLHNKNGNVQKSSRMLFRIGINIGDIIDDNVRIYGDGVNIAARIEAIAEGGGICISKSVHEQVNNKLDLAYENLGAQSVKNIKNPIQIYKINMKQYS